MAATIVGTRYRRVAPGTGFTSSGDNPQFVIPGLDPGIYERLPADGRVEPGHDDILHCDPTQIDFALILIIIVLLLLFGGGFGYSRWGYGGGLGIGGILLIVLVLYLLVGRGRF